MQAFNHLVAHTLPHVPKGFVKPFAKRYVAGTSIEDMLHTVREFYHQGIFSTIDVLGEFIHHLDEARATADIYKHVLQRLRDDHEPLYLKANISVKLTALGLLLDKEACYHIVRDIVETAKNCGNFVRIDMEDSPCTSDTIDLYLRIRQEFSNVGIVLQAYLKRTHDDAQRIIENNAAHIRLCKGIYVEPTEVAYQNKAEIHQNYLAVLEQLFQSGAYVGIATHHDDLINGALTLISKYQLKPHQYEFQMLLGVRPERRDQLVQTGHHVRVYVPFGRDWYAYSLRRLKENPAIVSHIIKNLITG